MTSFLFFKLHKKFMTNQCIFSCNEYRNYYIISIKNHVLLLYKLFNKIQRKIFYSIIFSLLLP